MLSLAPIDAFALLFALLYNTHDVTKAIDVVESAGGVGCSF
jgi:hypothetical protein